jgi:hypothetical protein
MTQERLNEILRKHKLWLNGVKAVRKENEFASIAHLVEQRPFKARVVGSTPTKSTIKVREGRK